MLRPGNYSALRRSRALRTLLIVLVISVIVPLASWAAPLTTVFVNGLRIDAYPIVKDGVSYLPIHTMAKALQVEITWNAKLNIVKVNGDASVAPVLQQDGKIYLPVESFVQSIGGTVSYDGRNNSIKVQTANGFKPSETSSAVASQSGNNSASGSRYTAVSIPKVESATLSPTVSLPAVSATGTSNPSQAPSVSPVSKGTQSTSQNGRTARDTSKLGYAAYSGNSSQTPSNIGSAPAQRSGSSNYSGTPEPYANTVNPSSTYIRPIDAPPHLSDNLTPGPIDIGQGQGSSIGPMLTANAQNSATGVFVPKTAENPIFRVTVSNLEEVPVIKDFYKPRTGYKFVIAYLSQQNVSNQVQIYTGRFSLMDQKSATFDYIEGLSNFWLVILRPYGVNFGYLVFEIPADSQPVSLVLHALNQAPLTVNL